MLLLLLFLSSSYSEQNAAIQNHRLSLLRLRLLQILFFEKSRVPFVLRVSKLCLVIVLDVKTNSGTDERERNERF